MQYKCFRELEKKLSNAADEVLSCALAHEDDDPFCVSIQDIAEEHDFDRQHIFLFGEMLQERMPGIRVHISDDEVMVYTDPKPLLHVMALPFDPERMEKLLDKSLEWIGKNESGTDLYDTLKNEIGMTNDEIGAAGFDLAEYFTDPDDEEQTDREQDEENEALNLQ